jgi:hypothetical protein
MNLVFFILLALEAGWGHLHHCSLCHLPNATYTSSTLWIIETSRDVHVFLAFSEWALNSFQHWLPQRSRKDVGGETNKNTLFQLSTYFHPLQTTHWNVSSFISPTDLLAPWKCGRPLPFPTTYPTHFKNQSIVKYLINFQKLNFFSIPIFMIFKNSIKVEILINKLIYVSIN